MRALTTAWSRAIGPQLRGRTSRRVLTTSSCQGPLRLTWSRPLPSTAGRAWLPIQALTIGTTSSSTAGVAVMDQDGCQVPMASGPCQLEDGPADREIVGGEGEGAVAFELDGEWAGGGQEAIGGSESDVGAALPERERPAVPVDLDHRCRVRAAMPAEEIPRIAENAGDLDTAAVDSNPVGEVAAERAEEYVPLSLPP